MSEIILYGVKGSPFVRKTQVLLTEKGVDYTIEAVMPFPAPAWFREINPAGRIPVMRDTSVGTEGAAGTIPDSSAICAYIERKHPEPALYPVDAFDYGRAVWLEEYADSEMAGPIGLGMFRPMIFPPMSGKERDVELARKTLSEKMPAIFDYLESQIKGREFIVGDGFGIADISLATQFVNLHHAGGRVDGARWSALADYVTRMHARPSFAACIEDEQKLFPPHGIEL
jgi:glutathione S-transferase